MKVQSTAIQIYSRPASPDRAQLPLQQPIREGVQEPARPQLPEPASHKPVEETNRTEIVYQRQPHRYYAMPAQDNLPSRQQAAMQAYTSTQQMSRESQGSGEYLGSIDLFA